MTRLAREKAAQTGELPHEFLLRVARGEKIGEDTPALALRIDAAKAAAPYYAPRLATVEHSGSEAGPIHIIISPDDARL